MRDSRPARGPEADAPGPAVVGPASTSPSEPAGTAGAGGSPWRLDGAGAALRVRRAAAAVHPDSAVTAAVVVTAVVFVFCSLHPSALLANTTPTGGDTGEHVWAGAYLMHHLLPHLRLSGWAPDWFAGFPVFEFYMVVPFLVIVLVTVGVHGPWLVPIVAGAGALAGAGWLVPALRAWRRVLATIGVVVAVVAVPVPYGVAFKITMVSGLLALPVCCWAFGKLAGLPFPAPALLALAGLFMIYNREPLLNGLTGDIIGGNMASTMTGEFGFSMSLALCVVYLGLLVDGLRTGRHRRLAALVLALTLLCHLIPGGFAVGATLLALVVWPGRARLRWALPVLAVAVLLTSFWVVPLVVHHRFVTDLGWRRIPRPGATTGSGARQTIWSYLVPKSLLLPLLMALVGALLSAFYRRRAGLFLAATLVGSAAAFAWIPGFLVWSARVLPFYYLSVFMLAALGVADIGRACFQLLTDEGHPAPVSLRIAGPTVAAAFTVVFIGVPLALLPGTKVQPGGVTWVAGIESNTVNNVDGYAKTVFNGVERTKPQVGPGPVPPGRGGWPEFEGIVKTLDRLGRQPAHGCGRVLTESGPENDTYGSDLSLSVLPYFTDSCMATLAGLYYESSATTPYEIMLGCELSTRSTCNDAAQYYRSSYRQDWAQPFAPAVGYRQLGLLGVKYYMAYSSPAVHAADASRQLTTVAVTGPWHVYQVRPQASALVTPLAAEPVVMANIGNGQGQWLDPAAAWFQHPADWRVMFAESGPASWARVRIPAVPTRGPHGTTRRTGDRSLPAVTPHPVTPATVTHVHTTDSTVSFDVDRVGSPVLVKVSYFPGWKVHGGTGPYRVAPNLMVVVPTAKHVELTFGRTPVDLLGIVLTVAALLALLGLGWLPEPSMPAADAGTRRLSRLGRRSPPVPTAPDAAV